MANNPENDSDELPVGAPVTPPKAANATPCSLNRSLPLPRYHSPMPRWVEAVSIQWLIFSAVVAVLFAVILGWNLWLVLLVFVAWPLLLRVSQLAWQRYRGPHR